MDINNEQIQVLQDAMKAIETYLNIGTMSAEERRILSMMQSNLGHLYRQRMKAAGHPDFQCF